MRDDLTNYNYLSNDAALPQTYSSTTNSTKAWQLSTVFKRLQKAVVSLLEYVYWFPVLGCKFFNRNRTKAMSSKAVLMYSLHEIMKTNFIHSTMFKATAIDIVFFEMLPQTYTNVYHLIQNCPRLPSISNLSVASFAVTVSPAATGLSTHYPAFCFLLRWMCIAHISQL